MYTRYFCSICNTKPDQISHHKSHLLTQKHIENRDKHEKELKYFSMFKIMHPNDWLNHDEIKEMIFEEYGKELTKENKHDILISMLNVIDKFVKYKPTKIFYLVVDGKPTSSFVEPSLVYNFETGLSHTTNRGEYLEWCIEKILKSKETIREKSIKLENKTSLQRIESIQRSLLSKVTSLNYEILKQIRLNEHNLNYFTPKGFEENFLQFVKKPDFLNIDNFLTIVCN
jgi:transcription termination factor NusB